jgi:NAD-dependent SIR2 family protein deacetylase
MQVDGTCRKCGTEYDAHWDKYPGEELKRILCPKCPKCGAEGIHNIIVVTDETNDYHH